MPPAIPPPLASYIQSSLSLSESSDAHSQTLITSVLSTPSPWLVLRLVYAALYGVVEDDIDTHNKGGDGGSRVAGPRPERSRTTASMGAPVVFASFLRPLSLWVELGKKIGLDIQSLLRSRRIVFVDGLTHDPPPYGSPFASGGGGGGGRGGAGDASPRTRLKSLSLNDVQNALSSALKSIPTTTTSTSASISSSSAGTPTPRMPSTSTPPTRAPEAGKPLIFLDGIDFLIACQPSFSSTSMQEFLSTLRIQSHALVLACSADTPLMHVATSSNEGGIPLERNHAHLVTALAHQSRWVLQLRGLDTGSAKDVSGVIRASKGGSYESNEDEQRDSGCVEARAAHDLDDAEWLYQLKGDGSVRVWGRGE
ncbi:hypothetical protein AYL99_06843 [Fonsecaea erecta]|uniref:Elongator complex protein 6 n=1 Tax=Fonsecaea erecta TaxID=1367422 RepID=A0A178ZKJ4_9EURO|nr:hypothetical protein AYL99_06843 [Fonsecaea erecta]OAP59545.1 hypothetical protein AYL99_06843 [Fonsecaea erecta]